MRKLMELVSQSGGTCYVGLLSVKVEWEHRFHTPQIMESFLRELPVGSWSLHTNAAQDKVILKIKKGVL